MTTLNEMIALHNELASKLGLPTRKGFDSKAKAEVAINALKAKIEMMEPVAVETVAVETVAVEPVAVETVAVETVAVETVVVEPVVRARRRRGELKIHERGPRGFKFGPVWNSSVISGRGVALMRQNFPKLQDHANFVGVEITADLNQAEIAKLIARAIS